MQRTPEPELMTDAEQVAAYAPPDVEGPNSLFSSWVLDRVPDRQARCEGAGCGPGDIVRRLAAARPGWSFDGIDGSASMIKRAREETPAADAHRIRFHVRRIGAASAPPPYGGRYEVGLSNSLLHHLRDVADLWTVLKTWLSSRAHVFVMDLLRLDTAQAASATVGAYASDEPAVLRRDYHRSRLATYRPEELAAQLDAANLPHLRVERVSDRTVIVWGRLTSPIRPEYDAMMSGSPC